MDKKKIKFAWELLMNMAQEMESSGCYMQSSALHYVAGLINDMVDKPTGVVPWSEQIHKEIDDMYGPESEFSKERLGPLRDTTNTETGD